MSGIELISRPLKFEASVMGEKKFIMKPSKPKYEKLLADIGSTIERARENAVRAINTELGIGNTMSTK